MQHLKWGVFGVILAAYTFTASAAESETRQATIADCSKFKQPEVATMVKNDFLRNRLPGWDNDKRQLGKGDPVAWINQDEISHHEGVWQITLSVRGSSSDKRYDVTVDCNKGQITYQVK
ncbi:MAG: protein YebF [Enterobacteriaceae bacterium]